MKTAISIFTISLLLIAFNHKSFAAEHTYVCEIEHAYDLADDNSLKVSNLEKQYKGKLFSVSRYDGSIGGIDVVPALLPELTNMVNRGTEKHSFQTVAKHIIDYERQFQLLEILEFKKGKKKPFAIMYMNGTGIVTGYCL